MSNIWEKSLYRSQSKFLIDTPIIEYDISSANINILFDNGILSKDEYNYLSNCDKQERVITIGKMQGSNPKITSVLKEGIKNARKIFIESNSINNSSILSIRNDAITVIGNNYIKNLDISDNVKFRISGSYRSYYNINNIDYLYNYDMIDNSEVLDIKGLGDIGISLHKEYMIDLLLEIFYSAQIKGIESCVYFLNDVYTKYRNKELRVEYYRELNPQSRYSYKYKTSMCSSIYADHATEYDKKIIDISYNENILRYLNRIYASIYFGTK